MWVSEDLLVKDSCGPESFRQEVAFTNNLITSLRPYIQGHVSFKDRSPSPKKVVQLKNVHTLGQRKRKNQNDTEIFIFAGTRPFYEITFWMSFYYFQS